MYKSRRLYPILRDRIQADSLPSKRQLVYRLEKWGMRKYNIGEPESSASPESQGDSEYSPLEDQDCEAKCAIEHDIPPGDFEYQHQVPLGIQAAEVLLAVCDTEGAWIEYYKAGTGANGRLDLTALARSAETEEQRKATLRLLEEHIPPSWSGKDLAQYRLLHTLVRDPIKDEAGNITRPAANFISSITAAVDNFLSPVGGSVNLIHYILLDNFIVTHREILTEVDMLRLGSVINNVDSRVLNGGFENQVQAGSFPNQAPSSPTMHVIRQCLAWCHTKLHGISSNIINVALLTLEIQPDQHQEAWKSLFELYGTLWGTLREQCTIEGDWPEWASLSIEAMHLSHAEVLASVCWLLVYPKDFDDSDFSVPSEDEGGLFMRSRLTSHVALHHADNVLWMGFRNALVRFNRPTVADTEENKAFKDAAMDSLRAFVKATLTLNGPDRGDELGENDDPSAALMPSLPLGGELMMVQNASWSSALSVDASTGGFIPASSSFAISPQMAA
ncbi:hypothetical protein CGCA056_v005186 [Colletotrichum aenigma]|uniref:uncharacterized protein n=1 Tax=Colletotrichum aenigma TaxID=1215731 RepID=UPI0018721A54|nr:uncharacterized protein CGCA056_v005186 [Colletotrichum aenigma]KAF5523819.1 hypothetical protein CGCA056_v005186 [Colletotrichum aenigma]